MNAWIMILIGVPAFAALSMAMEKHHEQFFKCELNARQSWVWRGAGGALLLLALLWGLRSWSTSVAVCAWLGALTFAALCVGVVLTYAAQHVRGIALACGVLSAVLAFASGF